MKNATKNECSDCFLTADIYLASVITLLTRTHPELITNEKSSVFFCFKNKKQAEEVVAKYQEGIALPANLLVEVIRRLRAELIYKKSGGME